MHACTFTSYGKLISSNGLVAACRRSEESDERQHNRDWLLSYSAVVVAHKADES